MQKQTQNHWNDDKENGLGDVDIEKLESLKNQVEELKLQKARVLSDLRATAQANREIQAASNAVMISVAQVYGTRGEDGSYTLEIPRVDVAQNLEGYELHGYADGDRRMIRIVPRTPRNGASQPQQGKKLTEEDEKLAEEDKKQ